MRLCDHLTINSALCDFSSEDASTGSDPNIVWRGNIGRVYRHRRVAVTPGNRALQEVLQPAHWLIVDIDLSVVSVVNPIPLVAALFARGLTGPLALLFREHDL